MSQVTQTTHSQAKDRKFISRKPVSVSFNVLSLISNLQVDRRGVDLFTMQSAKVSLVGLVQMVTV